MGCASGSMVFSREEVTSAIHSQKHTQARIEPMGERCAVLKGTNWVFNPALPHDPVMKARLEKAFPEDLSYEVAMQSIIQAFIDVHVGEEKRCTIAVMNARFDSLEQAVESACMKLNEQLRNSGVQFETDHGMTKINITDIKFRRHVRNRQGNTVTKFRQMETDLFIIFPDKELFPRIFPYLSGAQGRVVQGTFPNLLQRHCVPEAAAFLSETNKVVASSAAAKIKELKELFDCEAITQEEYDAKKAELLNQM